MKLRTCKICKCKFEPTRQLQPTCSNMECMIEYSNKHLKKQALGKKREANKKKKEFYENDKSTLLKRAQSTFNKFIRLRDKNEPCISCGKYDIKKINAGHYKPAGGYSYLRFNENNVHKQCEYCNTYLSANLIKYRENLIKKIGLKEVEKLEQPNQLKTWTVEELKEIIETYKEKIKELNE